MRANLQDICPFRKQRLDCADLISVVGPLWMERQQAGFRITCPQE